MATVLLAGVDLFFRGKLEALCPDHHFVTTDSVGPRTAPGVEVVATAPLFVRALADSRPTGRG